MAREGDEVELAQVVEQAQRCIVQSSAKADGAGGGGSTAPPDLDSGHDSNLSEGSRTPGKAEEDVYLIRIIVPNGDPVDVQIGGSDMVQELYHVLMERDQTCQRTCFKIHYEGRPLDHFLEIRNITNIKPRSFFHVVEEPYNVREARIHVRQLRDLLRSLDTSDAVNGLDFASVSCVTAIMLADDPSAAAGAVRSVRVAEARPEQSCLPAEHLWPDSKEVSLNSLVRLPATDAKLRALNGVGFSSFNPPPGPRKLKGDVIYLYADVCEGGRRFHITCCTKGFFVNASTDDRFDARPSPTHGRAIIHHSLFDLLAELSPQFRKTFGQLLKARAERNVYERLPTPYQTYLWLVPPMTGGTAGGDADSPNWLADSIRAEDMTQPHRIGLEDHVPGQQRDWNEELQTTHDMPRTTFAQRLCRDRAKFKVHSDFLAAAVRGAQNIVEGSVLAINAMEDQKTHMFIWNNIFFSLGFDVKDHYKSVGGDAAAHAAASADLNAVRAYAAIDTPKLHTLGMAVIDYRGLRLTAQSIIPGILEKEQEDSVVYGSFDSGKTVVGSATYNEHLERPAKQLHIAPHKIWSGKAEDDYVQLYTSYESKGITGNDGRHYLLDLLRTFPPDVNFMAADGVESTARTEGNIVVASFPRHFHHKLVALRQELIDAFIEHHYASIMHLTSSLLQRRRQFQLSNDVETSQKIVEILKGDNVVDIHTRLKELDTADAALAVSAAPKSATSSDKTETETEKNEEVSTGAEFANVLNTLVGCDFDVRFNPDCFCEVVRHAPDENVEAQRQMVRMAGAFLLEEQVPAFAQACAAQAVVLLDGRSLVEALHARGINLRYLGVVLAAVDSKQCVDYVLTIVKTEMLARCARRFFRTYIRRVSVLYTAAAVAHFLNCLLGAGISATGPTAAKPSVLGHFDLQNASSAATSSSSSKKNRKKQRKTQTAPDQPPESAANGKTSPIDETKTEPKSPRPSPKDDLEWRSVSQSSLWTELMADAWTHYGVKLGSSSEGCLCFDKFASWSGAQRFAVLRRVCQLTGVQLVANNYALDAGKNGAGASATPFAESNIYNLVPVVKHSNPRSNDSYNVYVSALTNIQRGIPRLSYDVMTQAHNMMNNVYGPLHSDIVPCLRILARNAFMLRDSADAWNKQHNALLIGERCNGVDHHDTVFDYISAAHYCFAGLQIAIALRFIYRARYLLLVLHGEDHILMGQIDANIGIMLYAIQEHELALKFLANALKLTLKYDPAAVVKIALLNDLMARIYAGRGDFRAALQKEKETYNIYEKLFGVDHEKTKASSECLSKLTTQAVSFQKRVNEARDGNQAHVHLVPMTIQPSTVQKIMEMLNLFNSFFFLQVDTSAARSTAVEGGQSDVASSLAPSTTVAAAAVVAEETLD